jgi:hypothetical protein
MSFNTESWDDSLRNNYQTSRLYESIQNADTWNFEYVTPNNYGINYGALQPGVSSGIAERFMRYVQTFPGVNAPDNRPNVVGSFWSYNTAPGGGRVDTSEAAFAFRTETYWNESGTHNFEFHLPEFQSDAGHITRLMSLIVTRPVGLAHAIFQIDQFYFSDYTASANNFAALGFSQTDGSVRADFLPRAGANPYVEFRFYSSNQVNYTSIKWDGSDLNINVNGWAGTTTIQSYRVSLGIEVHFDQFFGLPHDTTFFSGYPAGNPNHGFILLTRDGAANIADFLETSSRFYGTLRIDGILQCISALSATQIHLTGDATYGEIVCDAMADPTDTALGMKIWTDGANWFTYVAGVKKQFVLV